MSYANLQLQAARAAFVLLIALTVAACSGPAVDPRLQQAVTAVEYMTTQRFLADSAFSHVHPERRPSDYVSYLFSTMGSAEWPIAFDQDEEEQLRSARIPIMPRDLPIVPHKPNSGVDLQVVVRADDAAGLVIIDAYEKAGEDPVLVVERRLGE